MTNILAEGGAEQTAAFKGPIYELKREEILCEIFTRHRGKRIFLLEAPAGYGKSTLIRQWRHVLTEEGRESLYFSFSRRDNNPDSLQRNLLSVLNSEWLSDLPSRALNLEFPALVDHLLGAMDGRGHEVTVFLDGCEAIANPNILKHVTRAIESGPVTVRFVLAGRTAIQVPRAKAELSGQLVRLAPQDLAFSSREVACIADKWPGAPLAENELDYLCQMTGGWPAMLRIAGLELQGLDDSAKLREMFSGTNEIVSAYFLEEVLGKLPSAQRELLLKSSPLEFVSAPLCRSATGVTQAVPLLDELRRRWLLLDRGAGPDEFFILTPLFRAFLRSRLEVEYPGALEHILLKAAIWFRRQEQVDMAVDHAIRGGHVTWACDYLSPLIFDLGFRRGQFSNIDRWSQYLTQEQLQRYPSLKLGLVWLNIFKNPDEAADLLGSMTEKDVATGTSNQEAHANFAMAKGVLAATSDKYVDAWNYFRDWDRRHPELTYQRANVLAAWAYTAYALKRIRDAKRLCDAACEAIEQSGAHLAGLWISIIRARLALFEGNPREVAQIVEDLIVCGSIVQEQDKQAWGLLNVCLAEACYMQGNVSGALDALGQFSTGDIRTHVTVEMAFAVARLKGRLALANGDLPQAIQLLTADLHASRAAGMTRLTDMIAGELATILLRAGNIRDAWRIESDYHLSMPAGEGKAPSLDERQLVQSRLMISRQEYSRAASLAVNLYSRATSLGNISLAVTSQCVAALSRWHLGQRQEALRLMVNARMTAIGAGCQQIFEDEAQYLKSIRDDSVGNWCESSKVIEDKVVSTKSENLLSAREKQVISFVSKGLSNVEIARILLISSETVKFHIRNIVKKLEAKNRINAIEIAHELGILGEGS